MISIGECFSTDVFLLCPHLSVRMYYLIFSIFFKFVFIRDLRTPRGHSSGLHFSTCCHHPCPILQQEWAGSSSAQPWYDQGICSNPGLASSPGWCLIPKAGTVLTNPQGFGVECVLNPRPGALLRCPCSLWVLAPGSLDMRAMLIRRRPFITLVSLEVCYLTHTNNFSALLFRLYKYGLFNL